MKSKDAERLTKTICEFEDAIRDELDLIGWDVIGRILDITELAKRRIKTNGTSQNVRRDQARGP